MKETVQEIPVLEKEMAEIFINSEYTMPVSYVDQLEGHVGSALHGIFISTGRTKTAVTSERYEFHISTFGTSVHSATERRVTTMNHLLDVFNNSISRMKDVKHFFIMIDKYFLEYIHETIMQ